MPSGIYRITNVLTGESYIGQSDDLKQRKVLHFSTLRRGTNGNKNLQESFDRYGENCFEFVVILVCPVRWGGLEKYQWLIDNERRYLELLKPTFNMVGSNGFNADGKNAKKAILRSLVDAQRSLPLVIQDFAASGGRARAAKMTAEQRSEACRKAVRARWAKRKSKSKSAPATPA